MFKAASKLFSGSIAGKLAGILRETLLAGLMGTSGIVAAIRTAQSATLIPINFFTADSLSAGFLPLYSRYLADGEDKASALFWLVAGVMFVASVAVVILLFLGTGYWMAILVPGFDQRTRDYAIEFVRIMGLGVPFYVAGTLFSYLEMGRGGYTLASARASLQSAGMIAGTLAAFYLENPSYLAWGFTAAYVCFAAWGLMRIQKFNWIHWPRSLPIADVRQIGRTFWITLRPLLLLPVLLQGNIASERVVASLLGVATSAALDYAKFVTDTGVLLIAVPLGLAGLSAISRASDAETRVLLERLLPGLMLVTIPCSIALAVNGHLVIEIIYQRGAFGADSTLLTQRILTGYALGFWSQVISYILLKGLNAKLRNGEVFKIMVISLLANTVVNFGLYKLVGPAVLGLGGLSYGLIQFVLTVRAFDLWAYIWRRFSWLIAGALGYSAIASFVPSSGFTSLLVSGSVFVVFWLCYLWAVPLLRSDVCVIYKQIKGETHA